jgi:hypothetical protein
VFDPFPLSFGGSGRVLRKADCASKKAAVVLTVRLLGVRENILAIDSDSVTDSDSNSSAAVPPSLSRAELLLSRRRLFSCLLVDSCCC